MTTRLASISLDLDNQWSYLKIHGDPGWEDHPSYLDTVVPRFLDFFGRRGLRLTVFVVGQDAALDKNRPALASITAAGHEIGNHSFRHEPWLHLYSPEEIAREIEDAERHIEEATGRRPRGFRGPGFSMSAATLEALARRGYDYDASSFPTFLGPLAKAYYFMTARLDEEEKARRKELFGRFSDGFRPLAPHWIECGGGPMLEIPVTTVPIVRVPFHVSYIVYLAIFSRVLAKLYLRTVLTLCRMLAVSPSILFHPLDFLGPEDEVGLGFFPGMAMPRERKLALVGEVVDLLGRSFELVPMGEHARRCKAEGGLRTVPAMR